MKTKIILFCSGYLIWALLCWPLDSQHAIVGIFAVAFVVYMTADLFASRRKLFVHPSRFLWFLYYVPLFLWECFKANIDVAYRVMHPRLPLKPGIVKVKTGLKSDTALTFLANSITLTPGTLSVDIDKDNGILYVHWINVEDKDVEKASQKIVKNFEGILKRIFE